MATLSAANLSCGHSGPVLEKVDLLFEAGKSVALLGPNGSGKSTLLKTLAGLLPSFAGEVLVNGERLSGFKVRQIAQSIASVPQEEAIPFAFTVRQIVTMGRLVRTSGLLDSEEDYEAATQAMTMTDCFHLADRPADQISGGERQRALIARAIAQDTPILLMDEPTAHLDAPHQVWMVRLVQELVSQGRSVVVALHDLNLAAAMAQRSVLLANGSVLMDAATTDVLASPALDEAFKTSFERLTSSSGRPVVVPKMDF